MADLRPDRRRLGRGRAGRCRSTPPARRARRRRTRCCSTATAGARSDAAPLGTTTPSGRRRTRRRARSRRRCGACSSSATTRTRLRAGARAQPRLHRRSRSGAARSPTACDASAATTPRARSSARSATGARRSTRVAAVVRATRPRRDGEHVLTHETVILDLGPGHLERLETIVDPLVITDLTTLVWAPHGHWTAVEALRELSQSVLLDSAEDPDVAGALRRAQALLADRYVVDLAWLRSTPWRERIAMLFDPPRASATRLGEITALRIRNAPESGAAALLLCGWLRSRLGWPQGQLERDGHGSLDRARWATSTCASTRCAWTCPGSRASRCGFRDGAELSLDRGAGRPARDAAATPAAASATWTLLGASRGEGGILGEGLRQSLLRDPTYGEALDVGRGDADVSGSSCSAPTPASSPARTAALLASAARRRRSPRAASRTSRSPAARRRRAPTRCCARRAGTGSSCGSATSAASGRTTRESNYRMATSHAARARRRRDRAPHRGRARRRGGRRPLRRAAARAPGRRRCSTPCCSGSARTGTPRRCSPGNPALAERERAAVAVHGAPKPPAGSRVPDAAGAARRAGRDPARRAARARPRRSRACSPAPTRRSRRACSTASG